VPPFAKVILESALAHRRDQHGAAPALLLADGGARGVARRVEAVVPRPHVEAVVGFALRGWTGA